MSTCNKFTDDRLLDYVERRLPPEESQAVKIHLDECDDCAARAETVDGVASTLRDLAESEELDPVEDRGASALAQLRSAAKASGRRSGSSRRASSRISMQRRRSRSQGSWGSAAAAAAILFLLGITYLAVRTESPGRRTAARPDEPKTPSRIPPNPVTNDKTRATDDERPVDPRPEHQVPDVREVPPVPKQREPEPKPQGSAIAHRPAPVAPIETPESETEKTSTGVATLVRVSGKIRYRRGAGTPWHPAPIGVSLLHGDEIDTRQGMGELALGGESIAFLNRNTTVQVFDARSKGKDATYVVLARGEILIEDVARPVHVDTNDGIFSPVGTRFNVKRSSSFTTLTVESGMVTATAKKKGAEKVSRAGPIEVSDSASAVSVRAGHQSQVRQGGKPSAPKPVNALRVARWAGSFRKVKVLNGFETVDDFKMFGDNFKVNDSALSEKHVTQGRRCMKLTINPDGARGSHCLTGGDWHGLPTDWSGYEYFCLDLYSLGDRDTSISFNFRDTVGGAVREKRRDIKFTLPPGRTHLRIPIENLLTNDKSRRLDLKRMWMLLVCFSNKVPATVLIDNMRLEGVR